MLLVVLIQIPVLMYLRSTEIIEFDENGELSIRNGPKMYIPRYGHGMGVVTIGRTPSLIAFGGWNGYHTNNEIDVWHEIEMWNTKREYWKRSLTMLTEYAKLEFGFATVSTDLVCP